MTINSLKELKALIKLCRASGIDAIEVDNIKFQLRDKPQKLNSEKQDGVVESKPFTEEDMLFWSSTGVDNG